MVLPNASTFTKKPFRFGDLRVADWTISQKAARNRIIVHGLRHRWAAVENTRGNQDRPRSNVFTGGCSQGKDVPVLF
jgi:hypothetical protein